MAILKLKPACKSYLWGGSRLKYEYGKEFDGDILAETWELSCHPDGPSTIAGGAYDGMTLADYIGQVGRRVLGSNCQIFSEFPILIKFIDSRDNLSIQVHPNNVYAMETAKQYGKTEMWYILDAKPGAFLYLGFQHEISREEFKRRIEENTLTEVLNAVEVQKGQCCYIPAGTIHAIGKNIVIAEIQQSSNLTYRVYDYGRVGADGKPRQLHIEQALEVTKLTPPRMEYNFAGHLVRCPYFTADVLEAPFSAVSTDESFTSLLVLEGEGELVNGDERMTVRKGDSVFLPAESGVYAVSGTVRLLRTEVGTI